MSLILSAQRLMALGMPAGLAKMVVGTDSSNGLSLQLGPGEFLYESATDGITTTGSTQATAVALTSELNTLGTVAAGTGAVLPASAAGLTVFIRNNGTVNAQIYGNGSDTIDSIAGTTGVAQMPKSVVLYTCTAPGAWGTEGLATGYAGNGLQTLQYADGISSAGSTQATGTPLSAAINNVPTVAAGSGVNLPSSSGGESITVINSGVAALQVYAAQGAADTINGISGTIGIPLLPGAVGNFSCTTAGAWFAEAPTTTNTANNTSTIAASGTLTAANVTGGAAMVTLQMTGSLASGQTITLPSVASMVGALHNPTVGTSYRLRIINESAGAQSWTVAAGTGWTVNGTKTIAQNAWREWDVILNSGTAITAQPAGTGTFS